MFAAACLFVSSMLLPASPTQDVDIVLVASTQQVPPGCFAEVEVRLTAPTPTNVTAVDVIFHWDPSELQLVQTTPGSAGWFVAGYLPDPDGINNNLQDGTALFTALASPAAPIVVGPGTSVARLRFQVLQSGGMGVLASAGQFGVTRVLGANPGQDLTGSLPTPLAVLAAHVQSLELVRLGFPANPNAFRPGLTSGPVAGEVWDPYVDHQSFFQGALFDVLGLSAGNPLFNLPSEFGTILVDPGQVVLWLTRPAGVPFAVEVPPDCNFVGLELSAQAFSYDGSAVLLANALDLTLGS